MRPDEIDSLTAKIRDGNRAALARAITLVESRRSDHRVLAQALLQQVGQARDNAHIVRVGISGVPGVGKSTLIDQLGLDLIAAGKRVAVLAVDPSSPRTGGSILGDKTRMTRLSALEHAFVRPSPSGDNMGGVTRRTRETILLCEAAGFDIIVVETVGVGQLEAAVADMVDSFVLVMLPGAGDELQGIKKGVLELADIVAVNKADGDRQQAANLAVRQYHAALSILTPVVDYWNVPVLAISAQDNDGVAALWQHVIDHRQALIAHDALHAKRQQQQVRWMHQLLRDQLLAPLGRGGRLHQMMAELEEEVAAGQLIPTLAVDRIVRRLGLDAD